MRLLKTGHAIKHHLKQKKEKQKNSSHTAMQRTQRLIGCQDALHMFSKKRVIKSSHRNQMRSVVAIWAKYSYSVYCSYTIHLIIPLKPTQKKTNFNLSPVSRAAVWNSTTEGYLTPLLAEEVFGRPSWGINFLRRSCVFRHIRIHITKHQ